MQSLIRLRRVLLWPSLLVIAAGCGPTDRGLEPIMEDTSIHSLRDSALQASTAVEAAAAVLGDDPARASRLLEEASQSLRQLLEFFIPLQEAREHVYNAYRHLRLDEITSARHELDAAEEHLLAIARSEEGKLLREMEPLLELLEDARIALQVDPTEASEILRHLANRLNNMVVRGGLVVD